MHKVLIYIYVHLSILLLLSYFGPPATGMDHSDEEIVMHIRSHALALSAASDLDPLIKRAAGRRLVLLGEASHGTSEYYTWRKKISRRLIEEHGFDFILVEGDWPLALKVNRFVKHESDESAGDYRQILAHFNRWPAWMWANEEVAMLVKWMHRHNAKLPEQERSGFYGMDIYAHEEAMRQVLRFLERHDAEKSRQARAYYQCFSRFDDLTAYLRMVQRSNEHCGDEMERVRDMLEQNRGRYTEKDSLGYTGARQSARSVVFAERHIRANLEQGPQSWNHRVDHFFDAALQLLALYGEDARAIVWAHNTHIGDARATDMRQAGMVNIGQLAREKLGPEEVYAVGFGTWTGDVLAGRRWQGPMERMTTPPARPDSYEALMNEANISPMLLLMDHPDEHEPLMTPRGNRAVGVVYHPERDASQNFVRTVLPLRYDAFIFFNETQALTPLSF